LNFMKARKKLLGILFLLSLAAFTSCSGTSYAYVNEDSRSKNDTKVPAGSTKANVEFSIVTNYALPVIESDYPTISFYYSSEARVADQLKKLEVRLLVDEKEVTSDETVFSASHFNRTLDMPEEECCFNLGEKLGIGENESDFDYSFGVHVIKKYKSLKRLPEQISVAVSVTTDKGTFETVKKLSLKAYEDSNFIRVH